MSDKNAAVPPPIGRMPRLHQSMEAGGPCKFCLKPRSEWGPEERCTGKTIDVDAIMTQFYEGLSQHIAEGLCLTCSVKNSNWLAILQDCLEDGGVDMDNFIGEQHGIGAFSFHRGRLRLSHYMNCVNGEGIRHMLERLKEWSERP